MDESAITLHRLFAVSASGFSGDALSTIEARVPEVKDKLCNQVKGLRWASVLDEIVGRTADLLDVSLIDVMATAWSKYRMLAKYTDRNKYPPEETILVPLAEHTLKSAYHPYLELLIKGHPVGRLVFDVTIALTLKGFVLSIQDAKIKKVLTGSWQGTGTIALEGAMILEKVFDPIPLPGSINLGEGISLRA